MPDHIYLFIHNLGYVFSILLVIGLMAAIYFIDRKSLASKMAIALFASVAVFLVSHTLGVNVTDPVLSRQIFTFNVANIAIGVFATHCVLAILGKVREQKKALIFIYTVSIALIVFFLGFPEMFLGTSQPKMYFPNYYNGGSLYWIDIFWNLAVAGYFLYHIAKAYETASANLRSRLIYFFIAFVLGYIFGCEAYFLVLDINVDPIWSIFMAPSFALLFTYAILKQEVLPFRTFTKRALLFGILASFLSMFITMFNLLNNYVMGRIPNFPTWLLPLISAAIAVSVGIFVWKRLRENEVLKYEFITVVTHKFRTPLTHIKWAADNLLQPPLTDEDKTQLSFIRNANIKLVELTNLLMNVSEAEKNGYDYILERHDISESIDDVLASLKSAIDSKKVSVARQYAPKQYAMCDIARLKFVIQVFIENALHYTPDGGSITISLSRSGQELIYSVKDTGIGIAKEEVPLLFTKFYRGKQAKLADTEGMGIGLYISREVIAKHNGRIWAESEGSGKGSTFLFSIPAEPDNRV